MKPLGNISLVWCHSTHKRDLRGRATSTPAVSRVGDNRVRHLRVVNRGKHLVDIWSIRKPRYGRQAAMEALAKQSRLSHPSEQNNQTG